MGLRFWLLLIGFINHEPSYDIQVFKKNNPIPTYGKDEIR